MRAALGSALAVAFTVLALVSVPLGASAGDVDGGFRATPLMTAARTGPNDAVRFPIHIENGEPVPARFTFARASVDDGGPSGFQVAVPEALLLDATGVRGDTQHTATVDVIVYTPSRNGHVDERYAFAVRIDGAHASDPARPTGSAEIAFSVHASGWSVPGPALSFVLAAMAAAAAFARRPTGHA